MGTKIFNDKVLFDLAKQHFRQSIEEFNEALQRGPANWLDSADEKRNLEAPIVCGGGSIITPVMLFGMGASRVSTIIQLFVLDSQNQLIDLGTTEVEKKRPAKIGEVLQVKDARIQDIIAYENTMINEIATILGAKEEDLGRFYSIPGALGEKKLTEASLKPITDHIKKGNIAEGFKLFAKLVSALTFIQANTTTPDEVKRLQILDHKSEVEVTRAIVYWLKSKKR